MRVRILGGGVAGLAVALALRQRAGLTDVEVLERDAVARPRRRLGHGLLLMQNGVTALAALDALDLLDGANEIRRAIFLNEHGLAVRSEEVSGVYCVTRAKLVVALRERLADVMRYGCAGDSIRLAAADAARPMSGASRVETIRLADGREITGADADLFVGAEGVRSPLCAALNPALERPFSRVREVVTSTYLPDLAAQLGSCFVKTMFPERGLAFGLLAPEPGRVIGFLQFDGERYPPPRRGAGTGAGADELRTFVETLLVGTPEPVAGYVQQADFASAHVWHPVDAPLPDRLGCDNAVLLGDAGHPLLPFTSQGASAALEDAVVLADRLRAAEGEPRRVPDLLRAFAGERRADLMPYIDGGRRILRSFVGLGGFTAPYVDGAVSRLERYLSLPRGTLLQLFRVLDGDADGALHPGEVRDLLALLAIEQDDASAEQLFHALDVDRNGCVDIEELVLAFGSESGATSPLIGRVRAALSAHRVAVLSRDARVRRLFHLLDRNGDGRIDRDEFGAHLALAGVVRRPEQITRLFEQLDTDANGVLDVDELIEGLRRVESGTFERYATGATDAGGGGRAVAGAGDAESSDPLFADDAVDFATLRARAFNLRWAEHDSDIIPLTAADPDFPVAEEIRRAIADYVEPGHLSYGPAEGLPTFREVAARHVAARYALSCEQDTVMAVNSAASALYLVARFALNAGDEALIADPVDFLFERAVVAAGGRIRRYPLRFVEGRATFDPDEVRSLVRPGKTRLLGICNPHNPCGTVWTRAELETLAAIALEYDLWILSDEVWADIVYPPAVLTSTASLSPDVAGRTLSVYGFSKSYGLAGLRLGILVAPSAELLRRFVNISHADETAYGVSTLSQVAGLAAYRSGGAWLKRFLAHLHRQRDYALARLRAMPGVQCHQPEGTYVLFPDLRELGWRDTTDLVEDLREQHRIAIVPGSPRFFGPAAAGHARISYATSHGVLREGLDRLEAGLGAVVHA